MLMIHVGPLYSALQAAQPVVVLDSGHHGHAAHHSEAAHPPGGASTHHRPAVASDGPAWLAALELCGYCELLTLNPPLTLSLSLALPQHRPLRLQALPQIPLLPALRRSTGHPRAPPLLLG